MARCKLVLPDGSGDPRCRLEWRGVAGRQRRLDVSELDQTRGLIANEYSPESA